MTCFMVIFSLPETLGGLAFCFMRRSTHMRMKNFMCTWGTAKMVLMWNMMTQ
ncbi:hypothetical protein RJ641_023682 [Dillenia turbinata]|uniref:Uncharacterized protein n=1 Tax=Dillenia turbinata TaxID=194707 RepID=A0AAN8UCT6_9MAGN